MVFFSIIIILMWTVATNRVQPARQSSFAMLVITFDVEMRRATLCYVCNVYVSLVQYTHLSIDIYPNRRQESFSH
jgi:hypothetical protein